MPIGFIDSKKYGKYNVIISVCSVSKKKDVCLIRRFFFPDTSTSNARALTKSLKQRWRPGERFLVSASNWLNLLRLLDNTCKHRFLC